MLKLYPIKKLLYDTFLFTECPVCGVKTEKSGICKSCFDALENAFLSENSVEFEECGKTVRGKSVFNYEHDRVRSLIAYMKVNEDEGTARYAAAYLAGKVHELDASDGAWITYVPRSTEGLRDNGFDQSALLARAVSDILPSAVFKRLLKRTGRSAAQKRLSGKERKENVKGKFLAVKKTGDSPKNIVIVDDMFTTGSSMRECASTLMNAYPDAEIFCVTVAKNPLRAPKSDIPERIILNGH